MRKLIFIPLFLNYVYAIEYKELKILTILPSKDKKVICYEKPVIDFIENKLSNMKQNEKYSFKLSSKIVNDCKRNYGTIIIKNGVIEIE